MTKPAFSVSSRVRFDDKRKMYAILPVMSGKRGFSIRARSIVSFLAGLILGIVTTKLVVLL